MEANMDLRLVLTGDQGDRLKRYVARMNRYLSDKEPVNSPSVVVQLPARAGLTPYDCVIIDRLCEPEDGQCAGFVGGSRCDRPAFWLVTELIGQEVEQEKSCDWHSIGLVHEAMNRLP